MINWWQTNLGSEEKKSLISSFKLKKISQGVKTQELENKLAKEMKVPYVVVTNSGTSAIHISLLALDLKKDQEVIVPNLTWIATAQPIISCGAKPIFIDVDFFDVHNLNLYKFIPLDTNKKTNILTGLERLYY